MNTHADAMTFDGDRPRPVRAAPHATLSALGETRTPGLADLFVATMKGTYA